MGFELGRAKRNGKRRAKRRAKRKDVTQPLTNPISYIKMLSDLFMKAQTWHKLWPPISRAPKFQGGYSKNGKISEREPIYGLSIGAGLIWI